MCTHLEVVSGVGHLNFKRKLYTSGSTRPRAHPGRERGVEGGSVNHHHHTA